MRFTLPGCAALVLVAGLCVGGPVARAQDGTIMGRFNCMPQVPCDLSDPFYGDSEKLYSIGNACIGRNLGAKMPEDGYFDQSSGIDDKGCLTTSPNAFPGTSDGRTAPQCCVMTLANGSCVLHCNVVTE